MDSTIVTNYAEIYIPSRTLPYGTYELQLTVTMANATNLVSSASAYVKINPSGIAVNIGPYGTSTITWGYEQDLNLDPGTYAVDLDGYAFNTSVSAQPLQKCLF